MSEYVIEGSERDWEDDIAALMADPDVQESAALAPDDIDWGVIGTGGAFGHLNMLFVLMIGDGDVKRADAIARLAYERLSGQKVKVPEFA